MAIKVSTSKHYYYTDKEDREFINVDGDGRINIMRTVSLSLDEALAMHLILGRAIDEIKNSKEHKQ